MRRAVLLMVLSALAVPALALAYPASDGDGSLAITGASGTITLEGEGLLYGYFDSGALIVLSYTPDTPGSALSVSGATSHTGAGVTSYTGSGVRFLLPSGSYTLELSATGVDISAFGSGAVGELAPLPASVGASAGSSLGVLSLDGGKPLPMTKATAGLQFGKGP